MFWYFAILLFILIPSIVHSGFSSAVYVNGGMKVGIGQQGETFFVYEGGTGATPEVAGPGAWDISALATAGNWASVTEDDGKIGPGDTVYLMDDGGNHTGVLYVLSSGASGNPITIAAYPGDSPVVTGGTYGFNVPGQSYADISGIVFQNATTSGGRISTSATADVSYINIDDCEFNSNTNHGLIIDSYQDYKGYAASHITVENSEFNDNGQNGGSIEGAWDTGYITFKNCTVDGNNLDGDDRQGISSHTTHSNYTAGWTLSGGTVYYRSETNEPYNIYHQQGPTLLTEADGSTTSVTSGQWDWNEGTLYINIGEDPAGENLRVFYGKVHHVTIESCEITGTTDDSSTGYDGSGITFDFGTEDCTAKYNLIHGNDGHGISCIRSKDPVIYGNVIYDNAQGTGNDQGIKLNRMTTGGDVHDNTVVDNGAYGIVSMDGCTTSSFRNNNIYGATSWAIGDDGTGTSITEDYNNIYASGNSNGTSGITEGDHTQIGDPYFVNYAGKNFDIQTISPCKDHGTDTGYGPDYNGDAINGTIDIGAYEYE